MQGDNSAGVYLSQMSCRDRFFDWKEMTHFCKLVNDNEDSIIPSLGLGKASDKVHLDMIKLPFWNSKRLEETSWSLVFCFHPSTDITFIHELSNLSLHSCPPERLFEVMVHLRTAWVDRKKRIARFVHYDLPEITEGVLD